MIGLVGLFLVAFVWFIAPLFGPLALGIFTYKYFKNKHNNILSQIDLSEPRTEPRPQRTPDELIMYKSCVIEEYRQGGSKTVRIIKPDGKDLGTNFKSVSEAVADIDKHMPQ